MKVVINSLGVDIIDRGGRHLLGITEREALILQRRLTKLVPKIRAIIKRYKL